MWGGVFPITENDVLSEKQNRADKRQQQAENICTTIQTKAGRATDTYIQVEKGVLRYLTENERERLQGFPDNWTKQGNFDGEIKDISATQRYKMLGNAVTVDVVKLVGSKILQTTNF